MRITRYFTILPSLIILLGLSSCLSLEITLHLPHSKGDTATVVLEYRLAAALHNISAYPDLATLPLWEWDFRAIAAQSPGIELLEYSFAPARKAKPAVVRASLRFTSESDLRLLLGPEIYWRGRQFRWQLSAANEPPDASYPQLDGSLHEEEHLELEQLFAGQTLNIKVESAAGPKVQQLALADFLTGKRNIDLKITY